MKTNHSLLSHHKTLTNKVSPLMLTSTKDSAISYLLLQNSGMTLKPTASSTKTTYSTNSTNFGKAESSPSLRSNDHASRSDTPFQHISPPSMLPQTFSNMSAQLTTLLLSSNSIVQWTNSTLALQHCHHPYHLLSSLLASITTQ